MSDSLISAHESVGVVLVRMQALDAARALRPWEIFPRDEATALFVWLQRREHEHVGAGIEREMRDSAFSYVARLSNGDLASTLASAEEILRWVLGDSAAGETSLPAASSSAALGDVLEECAPLVGSVSPRDPGPVKEPTLLATQPRTGG
jgi:hypothetical protein